MATREQRERFRPMIISTENEVRLGAMGLTEPEAGSDVKALSTTAVRDGDDWILNGSKRFITNGGIADLTVVFATEDKSKGWGGLCAFVVEKGTPGLTETVHWKKMGIRASYTADIALDNVRVPADHRLGHSPDGGSGSSGGAGTAVGAVTEAVIWRAGWMANNNVPFLHAECSMAKCFPSDVAMHVTLDALQIAGGYGYMREFPLEKWVRDAKIFQIFEGTNEIQRLVISRALASAVV